MSTAEFDPTRSAAIRQLLLDTVAEAPRKERRTRFAIIGALTGGALALAGGTAALALTGVLHFGAPEQPPAPLPSPTQTGTSAPTSTPVPTATQDAHPLRLTTTPIGPHDVTSLPQSPAWSLDLPGTGETCEQRTTYDIADGYALFQVGSKAVGDATGDCTLPDDYVSLTMVDTDSGSVVWTREWSWTTEASGGSLTRFQLLGTTGRALVANLESSTGPREILDVATGRTIAKVDLGPLGGQVSQILPVGGESGDVLVAANQAPGSGQSGSQLARVDLQDVAHPKWARPFDGTVSMNATWLNAGGVVPVTWVPADGQQGYHTGIVDAATGGVTTDSAAATVTLTQDGAFRSSIADAAGVRPISGMDSSGATLWTVDVPSDASVSEVHSVASLPGQAGMPAGTGLLAAVTPGTMQVFDDATGALRWSADITHCGVTENSYRVPYLFDDLDAIVLDLGEGRTCALDAESGAPKPIPDTPSDGSPVIFGGSVDYVGPQWAEDSTGSAYDRESGEQLWSTPTRQEERWYFAGGVLIRQRGLHIEPLG